MVISRNLRTPLGDEFLGLRAGEQVTLSGIVYTARDEAHERMMKDGIPFDPRGAAVYHCGPVISGSSVPPPGQPPLPA
jgi:fumarate hydratase subunit beta